MPEVGEELFGFRLRKRLGRGAFACVYLAEQADLAGRPVVLKVSAISGAEPQTLARLQHTNIVPIFSVHEDPRVGLRAVCMPYFGGASLGRVIEQLASTTERPTNGGELVAALKAVASPAPGALDRERNREAGPADPPDDSVSRSPAPLALLRGLGYQRAVASIIAQLADGLHHAHQRGVLHRDIKPSNILISSDGQAFLLDFNVAQHPGDDADHAMLGGTVDYAAPEHLAALNDCTSETIRRVDRRSDLYSLGLVLTEMLTGERVFERGGSYSAQASTLEAMYCERIKGPPSSRRLRELLPWSLVSICRKSLDPDPARRYQQGDQMAEDLRRVLDDRPLRFAPELSRLERSRKFFRRHPRLRTAAAVATVAASALFLMGAVLAGAINHLAETRGRLRSTQVRDRKRAHDAGTLRALCMVNTIVGSDDNLRRGTAVCEEILALYRTPRGTSIATHPDWARLTPHERRDLAEDRRELLLLLAGARVRLARGDRCTLRAALGLLEEADALPDLSPSRAVWTDRAGYLAALGEPDQARHALVMARSIGTATAREHYLLAISHSREGGEAGYRRAIEELSEALRIQPANYWASLQRGICHLELGDDAQAIGDFGTCIGLWPDHPWGYFNRGYVLGRCGQRADAIADYTAALERDHGFVAALVNRGLARVELGESASALADFDRALSLGADHDASLHVGRGLALESLGRTDDADAAFRHGLALAPSAGTERARLLWTYGFAVSSRLPGEAELAFDGVLRHQPNHPQARYGKAMLAMCRGRLDEAVGHFDAAIEGSPSFLEARRYRAVTLARLGRWDPATRDTNWCLERSPGSGDSLYAAACVAALMAGHFPTAANLDRAFDLLARAVDRGAGGNANDDPDLAALRRDPRFGTLIAAHPRPSLPAPRRPSSEGPQQR